MDSPDYLSFVTDVRAKLARGDDDLDVAFNADTIVEEALEALEESLRTNDDQPLERFGVRWLNIGQS